MAREHLENARVASGAQACERLPVWSQERPLSGDCESECLTEDEWLIEDEDEEHTEHLGGCRWCLVRVRQLRFNKEPDHSNHNHHWNPPKLPGAKDGVSDWNQIDWSKIKDYYTEHNNCEYNLGPEDELPLHKLRGQIKVQHKFIKQQVEEFKQTGRGPDRELALKLVLKTPGFKSLEFQWSSLTPQEFVRNLVAVEAFGQHKEYLDSLAIPVDSETLHQFKVIPKCRQKQYSGVEVRITRTSMWSEDGHEPDFCQHFFKNEGYLKNPPRVFYRFAYSSVGKIFCEDARSNAYIVKALLEAGPDSGVFLSVVGRALEDFIWSQCCFFFMISRLVDFCYLMALATVGFRLRQDRTMWWSSYCILWFCMVKSLMVQFFEIGMLMRQYGWQHFIDKWLTPWNATILPAEVFSLSSVMVFLLYSPPEDDPAEPEFLKKHPIWLSFVCGAKWFEFLVSSLCIRSLGLNVLPAVNAMFSKESLWFLAFVLACVVANFGDYYMIPIPENYKIGTDSHGWMALFAHEGWKTFLFSFMKIFRMDIMGDFDIWELQGLDEEVKTTGAWRQSRVGNGTEVAYVDEPHIAMPYTRWHYGIRVFFMVSCLLIHLMILNVYIGLLTKIYEQKASKKRQLLAEFRMVFALKQLLCRQPFAELRKWLGYAKKQEKAGIWISYDPNLFRSESYGLCKDPISNPDDKEGPHFY